MIKNSSTTPRHSATGAVDTAPVWQLLRRNISVWQLAGYAVANMVGLAIIVTALMFYTDATTTAGASEAADPFFSSSFEVIKIGRAHV